MHNVLEKGTGLYTITHRRCLSYCVSHEVSGNCNLTQGSLKRRRLLAPSPLTSCWLIEPAPLSLDPYSRRRR